MKLNYPQKESGLYILSREDIENIAEDVLKEFFPQNLILPKPLDTAELLEDRLGLTVKQKYIGTLSSAVLGLIVMSDEVEIPSYDEMYKPTVLQETYGTVLINKHLCVRENTARRRYTETHEGAHFILHGEYFKTAANSLKRFFLVVAGENKSGQYHDLFRAEIFSSIQVLGHFAQRILTALMRQVIEAVY